jgi:hypothetical protein
MLLTSAYQTQYKMASRLVTPNVEQSCIIKFLVKEEVKALEILHRLNTNCWEETLSPASSCDGYNKLSETRKAVANLPHAHTHVQPTAGHNMNIRLVDKLIFGNRRTAGRGSASSSGISVRRAETIIHEH